MKRNLLAAVALGLLISGCSIKEYTLFQDENNSVTNKHLGSPEISYSNKISPRDRLSIEIFNGEKPIGFDGGNSQNYLDPTRGYMVSERGTVYLPLVGYIEVAGLSEAEAGELLTKVYGKYLKFPFVKLDILNQRVYVLGEVQKPGVVPVTNETLNLFEALAQVGDFTDYANRKNVKIVTYIDGKPYIRDVDMTNMKSIQMANLTLRPNDIIYIPPKDIKVYNVYLKDSVPLLDTISKLLTPFVNIKYLRN